MSTESSATRRDLLKASAATALIGVPGMALPVSAKKPFVTLLRTPDLVRLFDAKNAEIPLEQRGDVWAGGGAEVLVSVQGDHAAVTLRGGGVSRVQLRWRGDLRGVKLYLGDAWERSYADLHWEGEAPNRVMPWYFMAFDGKATHGYGVRTGAGAMCFWNADSEGVSLWADVRSGGVPVEFGGRELRVAEVVCREGGDASPFASTQAFCRQMCTAPRLPSAPVYGTNDWNYAYGKSSAELIAGVAGLISELSPDVDNRPYSVIDEGWQMGPYQGRYGYGPWVGNPNFGEMDAFAARLKGMDVQPGLWFRPLTPLDGMPESWRSGRDKGVLDPTVPEVREHVASHFRRFVGWGYEMIKHDFTSWDLFGQWGNSMGPSPTRDGWRLHDASRTNAEVLTDLYALIRDAAGDARLIGCNTVGHLAAGTHEISRTGDDTSGRSWNRNRRMGVNTLAFRAPQHRAFYEVDPDIVSITKAVPWSLVEQWLRLVSESGVSLFVAVEPSAVEPRHREALKRAFAIAAKPQPTGEPLDWTESLCPRRWKLRGNTTEFAWMGESGAWPFGD